MRAIRIDVSMQSVTVFDFDGGLAQLQAVVGGNIERAHSLPTGDDIFVNEEGLLGCISGYFYIPGAHQPFAGNGVVVGGPSGNGNTTDAQISLDSLRNQVEFLDASEHKRMTEILDQIEKGA